MSWTHLSVVSDTEIGRLEPQAVASGSPWGAQTWAAARTEAKADLRIWLERDYPEIAGVADRVRDRWNPDIVLGYTGGAYTDVTTEARDDTADDLDLAAIFAAAGTDRLYVASTAEFDGVFLALLETLNATTSTLTVNYWDGGAWADLSATDGTASGGATFATSGRITWTVPSDWERRDLNDQGEEYYWVELVVSVTPDATTAGQVLPIRPPLALKRCGVWMALYHVLNGLGVGAADPELWHTKAERYREMAIDLWASVRIPLDVNLSGGVTPIAEERHAHPALVRMPRA